MSRSDRLMRLLQTFRRLPAPVTAARLAEETGVSVRTLYRDIEGLRAAGAVIDGAAGWGYSLTEDPALPPQSFSRTEIEALVVGLGDARQHGDAELSAAAQSALAKIIGTLTEDQQRQAMHAVVGVYRLSKPPPQTVDLSLLREACWTEEALDLGYVDAVGQLTKRRVYPLSLIYLDDRIMLLAWCCLRREFRKFLTHRIRTAELSGQSFRPRRVSLLRAHLAELRAAAS